MSNSFISVLLVTLIVFSQWKIWSWW